MRNSSRVNSTGLHKGGGGLLEKVAMIPQECIMNYLIICVAGGREDSFVGRGEVITIQAENI